MLVLKMSLKNISVLIVDQFKAYPEQTIEERKIVLDKIWEELNLSNLIGQPSIPHRTSNIHPNKIHPSANQT